MPGGSGNNLPVMLGPLELTGVEVPDTYDRAGTMQPVVHRLIGGGRIVQLLGSDPARRRLQGTFTGPLASERAQLLEALRDSGSRLLLMIGAWQEFVVITSLALRYTEQGSVVQYLLEAEPLPGGAAGLVATAAAVLATAASEIAFASAGATIANAAGAVSGLSSAGLAASLAQTTMSIPAIDLTGVASSLGLSSAASEASLASLAAAAPVGSLVSGPADLATATTSAQSLAASVGAQAYTSCAAGNLALLQTGAAS